MRICWEKTTIRAIRTTKIRIRTRSPTEVVLEWKTLKVLWSASIQGVVKAVSVENRVMMFKGAMIFTGIILTRASR